MASTFDDDERSAAQGRPIDLYKIETPTAVYRLTSHIVDVSFGGSTYVATTMSRGVQQVAQDLTGRELIVILPITHPLVQRFAATGIPEHEVLVTLTRLQEKSWQAQQQWSGFAGGLIVDGHTAQLRVPSLTDDAMKVKLPVIAAQKSCNHRLGDRQCSRIPGVDGPDMESAANKVPTTIASFTGTTLVIASIGGKPDSWATFGDVLHVATGQRRQCIAQVGTTLTLSVPFVGAVNGDIISVYAGCDHLIVTCRDKFANVANFGGHPEMTNTINPWLPKGIGVIQQI